MRELLLCWRMARNLEWRSQKPSNLIPVAQPRRTWARAWENECHYINGGVLTVVFASREYLVVVSSGLLGGIFGMLGGTGGWGGTGDLPGDPGRPLNPPPGNL